MICFSKQKHLKNTINEDDLHSVDVRGLYLYFVPYAFFSSHFTVQYYILNESNRRLACTKVHGIATTIGNLMVFLNDL